MKGKIEMNNHDKQQIENLKEFKEKYISVNTNDCTKQLVEFIVSLIRNEKIAENDEEKIKEHV